MNYLAHLFLSDRGDEALVGALMGDFVKGRLEGRYPGIWGRALRLHRTIDSYSNTHPITSLSRRRLDPEFGHYRGIVIDVVYDHFLARHWSAWSDEPLAHFVQRVYRALVDHEALLPESMRSMVQAMVVEDWLTRYADVDGISKTLTRMGRRVRRTNPLAAGGEALIVHYDSLEFDFGRFFPVLTDHAQRQWREIAEKTDGGAVND